MATFHVDVYRVVGKLVFVIESDSEESAKEKALTLAKSGVEAFRTPDKKFILFAKEKI